VGLCLPIHGPLKFPRDQRKSRTAKTQGFLPGPAYQGVNPLKGRIRKEKILEILSGSNVDPGLPSLIGDSPKRIVNALFPLLYSQDDLLKWRVVKFMGICVGELAQEDLESARNVVRRLMWNLNDESGGIGWGSPEAMGEVLSRNEELAKEFAPILLSYADKDGNYLELPMLQRGLLWGIARFSAVRPKALKGSKSHFFPYLESKDSAVRGHAASIVGWVGAAGDGFRLWPLLKDDAAYTTYADDRCVQRLVSKAAREALLRLETRK